MKRITFLCLLGLGFFCDFLPEAISSHTTKSNLGLNIFEPSRYDCVGKSLVFAFLLICLQCILKFTNSAQNGQEKYERLINRRLGSETQCLLCVIRASHCVVFRSGRRAENWLARMQLVISSCCSPALEICTCTIMHRDVIVTKYTFICSTKPRFALKRLLHWTLSIITLQNSFSQSVLCLFSEK